MGENSNIAWTDHTYNAWIGCTEVGPPCDSCYARELDKRYQYGVGPQQAAHNRVDGVAPHWGPGVPRHRTSLAVRDAPYKWNRAAEKLGVPAKVFAHSLSDVFDNEVPEEWRLAEFETMRTTPWLRWQILTKRLPNVRDMLPSWWPITVHEAGLQNVGLVVSCGDQKEYDRDRPRLMTLPFAWHGFSLEPQIEQIDIRPEQFVGHGSVWFITGGESYQPSSPKPMRVYDPGWAAQLIAQTATMPNLYPFVKQMGCKPIGLRLNDKQAGANPLEWPERLRVREFPPELLN